MKCTLHLWAVDKNNQWIFIKNITIIPNEKSFPCEKISMFAKNRLEFNFSIFHFRWENFCDTTLQLETEDKQSVVKSMKPEEEMEGGINILLIVTVVIGTTLMTSLIVCYICVFKSLCCPSNEELERAHSMMRRGSSRRRFNRPSVLETNVSSQPTEIERV